MTRFSLRRKSVHIGIVCGFWGSARTLHLLSLPEVRVNSTPSNASQPRIDSLALERSRLAATIESLVAGVLIEDDSRRIRHVNSRFCAFFAPGARPEDFVGADCAEAADDVRRLFADPDGFVDRVAAILAARQPVRDERLLMADGRVLERDYAPIFVASAYRGHVWVYRDVTERDASRQALEARQAEVAAILASTLDAIITIEQDGTIRSANPAVERLFGYTPSELVGEGVGILMPAHHRTNHPRYLADYLSTGTKKVIGQGREVLARRKDGSQFPAALGVTELWIGERRLFTGVLRDITARREAEARLRCSLEELERTRDNMLAVLNQLRVGTVVLAEDETIQFMSDCCARLEGVDPRGAIGQGWTRVLPMDRASRVRLSNAIGTPADDRGRIRALCRAESGPQKVLEIDVRDDPSDPSRKLLYLYDISEVHRLRRDVQRARRGSMVGDSAAMRRVYRKIDDLGRGDWTVLIEGETGAGKELVASAIHAASDRRDGPFVPVNCAGLTDNLLASQLFGHRRGAFTGAVTDQQGLFEAADGGTLFLDEIGDISPSLQSMLLRALQEREVLRVGDVRPRKVDVRIIAATNRDLAASVEAGGFRADLFYRIRVARIRVPPLRERREDIPLLVSAFLSEQRVTAGRSIDTIDDAAMRRLQAFHWPGNVRELRSAVEYAVIHSASPRLTVADLPPELGGDLDAIGGAETEGERILRALEEANGNRSKAARLLGISRATLYRKLAAHAID